MLQAKVSILEQDLDHKRRIIERTETENIALIKEISTLRIREGDAKRQHRGDVVDLQRQLDAAIQRCEAAESAVKRLSQHVSFASAAAASASADFSTVNIAASGGRDLGYASPSGKATLDALHADLARKELEITELRAMLRQQRTSPNKAEASIGEQADGSTSYHVLEGRLLAMQGMLEARAVDVTRETQRSFAMQQRCDGLLAQIRLLQAEIEGKDRALGQQQVTNASTQHELVSLKAHVLTSAGTAAVTSKHSTRLLSNTTTSTATNATSSANTFSIFTSAQQGGMGQAEPQLTDDIYATAQWIESQKALTDLHQTLREARVQLDAAESDKRHAEQTTVDAKDRTAKARREVEHVSERLSASLAQLEQLRATADASEASAAAALAKLDDVSGQLERAKASAAAANDKLRASEADGNAKEEACRNLSLTLLKLQPLEEVVETQRRALERAAQTAGDYDKRLNELAQQLREAEGRAKEGLVFQSTLSDTERELTRQADTVAGLRQQLTVALDAKALSNNTVLELSAQVERLINERGMIQADTKQMAEEMYALEKQAGMTGVHERRVLELDSLLQDKHAELKHVTVQFEELRLHCAALQAVVDDVQHFEHAIAEQMEERQHLTQRIEELEVAIAAERDTSAAYRHSEAATRAELAAAERTASRVGSLEGTLARVEDDLALTRSQLHEKDHVIERATQHIHLTEIDLDREKMRASALEGEVSDCQSQIFDKAEKIATLERALGQYQVQLGRVEVHADTALKHHQQLKKERDDAVKAIDAFQQAVSAAKVALGEANAREEALGGQLKDALHQREHYAMLSREKEDQCSQVRSLYTTTSSKLLEIEEQLAANAKRVANVAVLEGKITALTEVVEKKETERLLFEREVEKCQTIVVAHERAVNNAKHLDGLIVQLREALKRQELEYDDAAKKSREATRALADKEAELQTEVKETRRLRDALQNEQKHRDILTQELQRYDKMTKNIAALEGKLSGLSTAYQTSQQEVSTLSAELELTKTNLRVAKQVASAASHQQNETIVLRQTIAGKEESIKLLEEELERKGLGFQRLLQDVASKESALKAKGQEQFRDGESSRRHMEVADALSRKLEETSQELRQEKAARQAETIRLQSKVKESLDTISALEAARAVQQERLARSEDERVQLRNDCNRFEAQIGGHAVNLSIVAADIEEKKAAAQQATQALLQQRQQCQRLTTELLEGREKLRDVRSAHEAELRSRDADMAQLQGIVDELKREMVARGSVVSARVEDADRLRRTVKTLESDNTSLRQKLDFAVAQTDKFKALLHRQEAMQTSGSGRGNNVAAAALQQQSAEITMAEYEIQISQLSSRCVVAEKRAAEMTAQLMLAAAAPAASAAAAGTSYLSNGSPVPLTASPIPTGRSPGVGGRR